MSSIAPISLERSSVPTSMPIPHFKISMLTFSLEYMVFWTCNPDIEIIHTTTRVKTNWAKLVENNLQQPQYCNNYYDQIFEFGLRKAFDFILKLGKQTFLNLIKNSVPLFTACMKYRISVNWCNFFLIYNFKKKPSFPLFYPSSWA